MSPHEARRIAVAACVCERTVRRYFRGLAVRSTCRARIDEALKNLGLEAPSLSLGESRPPSDVVRALVSPEGVRNEARRSRLPGHARH